jgi:hypothetical protein
MVRVNVRENQTFSAPERLLTVSLKSSAAANTLPEDAVFVTSVVETELLNPVMAVVFFLAVSVHVPVEHFVVMSTTVTPYGTLIQMI